MRGLPLEYCAQRLTSRSRRLLAPQSLCGLALQHSTLFLCNAPGKILKTFINVLRGQWQERAVHMKQTWIFCGATDGIQDVSSNAHAANYWHAAGASCTCTTLIAAMSSWRSLWAFEPNPNNKMNVCTVHRALTAMYATMGMVTSRHVCSSLHSTTADRQLLPSPFYVSAME